MKELINKIRVARAKKRMTQGELAKKVGISRQSIHAIENGKFEPGIGNAIKIAEALGTKVNKLFKLK